jgi:atypical dual specificity phosphatase
MEQLMRNFYWVIDDRLAGCSRPGWTGPRPREDGHGADAGALAADLAYLRERGITALLSLTETPLPASALDAAGILAHHVPIADMTAPTPEQFEQALAFIDRQVALRRRVAVHCLVGEGRTGTLLAAYLIRTGYTPDEAIHALRAVRSGAITSEEQQRALRAYAARRDWIA